MKYVVLLVVIVPRIVPLKYVSTTLGAHKAVSGTMMSMTTYVEIVISSVSSSSKPVPPSFRR